MYPIFLYPFPKIKFSIFTPNTTFQNATRNQHNANNNEFTKPQKTPPHDFPSHFSSRLRHLFIRNRRTCFVVRIHCHDVFLCLDFLFRFLRRRQTKSKRWQRHHARWSFNSTLHRHIYDSAYLR